MEGMMEYFIETVIGGVAWAQFYIALIIVCCIVSSASLLAIAVKFDKNTEE
jgi:hypothetical protein